jgi:hypothetical protein
MSTKRNCKWGWMILAGGLSGAVPGVLTASPVTYTYTGLPFQVAAGHYTTSDFVSGYFTVPTALGDGILFIPRFNSGGSWVVSGGTSAVPEPGNVAVIGLGLVRRKLRQA